jgi:hypothetical protein
MALAKSQFNAFEYRTKKGILAGLNRKSGMIIVLKKIYQFPKPF